MAPAATISFSLQAALSWRGIILQLHPLCHSLHGWGTLQNKNNIVLLLSARRRNWTLLFCQEACTTEQSCSNSPRSPSLLCCCTCTATSAWGKGDQCGAWWAAAYPTGDIHGVAVFNSSGDGEWTQIWLSTSKGREEMSPASKCLQQRIASNKPLSSGNNQG